MGIPRSRSFAVGVLGPPMVIVSIWLVFLEVWLSWCHLPGEETARDPFIQGIRGVFIVKSGSGDVDSSSGWFKLGGLERDSRWWSLLLVGFTCYYWCEHPSFGWLTFIVLVFPKLNAKFEFAVNALSECSSAQVILTWSLQYTALSKGWHRTSRFIFSFFKDWCDYQGSHRRQEFVVPGEGGV